MHCEFGAKAGDFGDFLGGRGAEFFDAGKMLDPGEATPA